MDEDLPHPPEARGARPDPADRALMAATRTFMTESRGWSWFHLVSTFAVLAGFVTGAAIAPSWPLQLLASVGAGLTMVRAFILVHDLHHGAIFRDSLLAKAILEVYGLIVLTPGQVWRDTHNAHHGQTAKIEGDQRGTFALYSIERYQAAPAMERFRYRIERHPLTFLLGYLTVFAVSFGIVPFLRHPRRYWDSGLSVLAHIGAGFAAYTFGGAGVLLYAFLIPFVLSGAVGAYLFYTQHNFEGLQVPSPSAWSPTRAALDASSYLHLGPVMRWFTGDIGFHHVHHLNPRIPFYRLHDAMHSIPRLQHPVTVRLRLRTILSSFRLNLWDPIQGKMVGYRAARTTHS